AAHRPPDRRSRRGRPAGVARTPRPLGGVPDMNRIIAALDNGLAARPVMRTATALAPLLDARVEALHVADDGDRTARQAAEEAGGDSVVPRAIIGLAEDAEVDIIGLHVYQDASLPAFTDQPQHEREAWGREFVRRYCRWRTGTLRLETRVGRAEDLLPVVAEE